MAEAQIQLPPDSTGKGIHLVPVTLTDSNGNSFTAYQEVVTIADSSGTYVSVLKEGTPKLAVISTRELDQLEQVIRSLRRLEAILVAGLGVRGRWDNDLIESEDDTDKELGLVGSR